MHLHPRLRFLPLVAAAAASLLLGCSQGLDFDNDSFPAPFVALVEAPPTCQTVGGGQILFDLADLRVTQGFAASTPSNRVDVSGTVSGFADTDSVELIVLPATVDCPIVSSNTATVTDSSFTARADIGGLDEFRVVLVAHSGASGDVDCDDASGCLSAAAGGFTAMSIAVEVRLTD